MLEICDVCGEEHQDETMSFVEFRCRAESRFMRVCAKCGPQIREQDKGKNRSLAEIAMSLVLGAFRDRVPRRGRSGQ